MRKGRSEDTYWVTVCWERKRAHMRAHIHAGCGNYEGKRTETELKDDTGRE